MSSSSSFLELKACGQASPGDSNHLGICLCSMFIPLSGVSNLFPMFIILFSAYFGGNFATIGTVKVKLIPDFYTLAIVLIN